MKKPTFVKQLTVIMMLIFASCQTNYARSLKVNLGGKYNLGAPRKAQVQYYHMETVVISRAPNGKEIGKTTYLLDLKCEPSSLTGINGDTYTCLKFAMQNDSGKTTTIPALKDWVYVFHPEKGYDEKGQVLGIDHAKFEHLTDSNGQLLPSGEAYFVYNTFIDFHSFCDVFGSPTTDGKGIQDLHKIGDKIVHSAAYSEAPVDLGRNVAKGSTFTNGKITLTFKGLSRENNTPLALVGFDSGDSHFVMKMEPSPDFKVETQGSSHYLGDLYVNLQTRWINRVEMNEVVVAQTKLPAPNPLISSVTIRHTVIQNISKSEILTTK